MNKRQNRQALIAFIVMMLVAIAWSVFGRSETACDRLARERERTSEAMSITQPGTELFRYAESKQAALYDEMQREGCPSQ